MSKNFEEDYWHANYSSPDTMDGIYNAKAHANYIKSIWELEDLPVITNFVDLGIGLGHLSSSLVKILRPKNTVGIEPSRYAFDIAQKNLIPLSSVTNLKLYNESIEQWCKKAKKEKNIYQLGICSSVFQYLSTQTLETIIPILSRKINYLYLTVPTDKEQKNMKSDFNFVDKWAYSRTQSQYHKLLSPHFAVVSSRLLESKKFFNERSTAFTNLLYRF